MPRSHVVTGSNIHDINTLDQLRELYYAVKKKTKKREGEASYYHEASDDSFITRRCSNNPLEYLLSQIGWSKSGWECYLIDFFLDTSTRPGAKQYLACVVVVLGS